MNDESIKPIPSNRLQYFPIMMFAIVMGLGGLSLVFKKAHEVFGFSQNILHGLVGITVLIYLFVCITYLLKIVKYPEEVAKEIKHPIRVNFFAAFSIATLLVSMLLSVYSKAIAEVLFYIGAIVHICFTLYTIKFWINHSLEIHHSNPAWFIPIVGNLIVPLAGYGFIDIHILYFYFSIGIFFWIILFAIILNRLIFNNQFAPKFMPTLFILIAPPAIGFLAYFKLVHQVDFFAYMLFSLGLFFTLLIFVMYKNFIKIKFFISWWAFTFPAAATTLSTILMYSLTKSIFYEILSYVFIFSTLAIVLIVACYTIIHIIKKEICILE